MTRIYDTNHYSQQKDMKQEYGTDSYNRASNVSKPIAPTKGHPSLSMHHKRGDFNGSQMKKQVEQSLLKRHRKFSFVFNWSTFLINSNCSIWSRCGFNLNYYTII